MQTAENELCRFLTGEGNKPGATISTAGNRKKLSLKIASLQKQGVRTGLWHVFIIPLAGFPWPGGDDLALPRIQVISAGVFCYPVFFKPFNSQRYE